MERAIAPQALAAALDRAVEALVEAPLDGSENDRLLLDLTRLESDVDTWKSTVDVLVKHLTAA